MSKTRADGSKSEKVRAEAVSSAINAASCLILPAGAIACAIYLVLELLFLTGAQPLIAQSTPQAAGVRLEAGIEKEEVDGDLKSAMDIYQKIAADTSAPRDVRAKALLRLAGCDEKLGRQARQIYEQIVHDFADQPAAAQARNRLAAIRQQEHPAPPASMSLRKIEMVNLGTMGSGDTDGERAVYWSAGHLYFGDLAGHSRHSIGDFRRFASAPSRDFSMVALNLKADSDRPHTLAVIKTDGTGYRELLRDDANANIFGITSSFNVTWSWDDKYVEVSDFSPMSNLLGQVWIVSVADGRRRVLADQSDGYVRKAVFSPNGHYVAYEAWPRNDVADQTSRVFVVPFQGGEPRLVFESARWKPGNGVISLMDWTVDGRYLAVHDVRRARSALYLLPMKDGAATGEATFVRYGEFDEGYSTAAGALIVEDNTASQADVSVLIASIGPDGHLGAWKALALNARNNPWPSFSPDGKQIAYAAFAADPAHRSLVVRDLATGQEREIYQSDYGSLACQYSVHNPRVFCSVEKEKGESELFSIEVESGTVEHIATFPETRSLIRCGGDDQTFYFSPNGWRWRQFDPPIIEWNRSTGQETVIAKGTRDREEYQMPSPDGRSIVGLREGTLSVRPTAGGDWVPLVSGIRVNSPVFATPDGNWVFYQDFETPRKIGLFRVPITGGKAQHIGAPPDTNYRRDYFFSPDGRQVLVWQGAGNDLWLLDNFEPSSRKQ